MNFNPDISKQANEVAFSRKTNKVSHRSLTFDNMPVAQTNSQKHLGMQIDNTLNSMNVSVKSYMNLTKQFVYSGKLV